MAIIIKTTLEVRSRGNKTAGSSAFDAENENPADRQQAGWQAILNHLKKYTEGQI